MVLQGYLAWAIGCSGPQQTSIFALVGGEKSLQDAVEEQLDFRLQLLLLLHLVLSCDLNHYRENFLCSLIQTYCEAVMASICHFVTTHFHPVLLCFFYIIIYFFSQSFFFLFPSLCLARSPSVCVFVSQICSTTAFWSQDCLNGLYLSPSAADRHFHHFDCSNRIMWHKTT